MPESRFWYSVVYCTSEREGAVMSAENEHSENGGEETREDGGAIATSEERLVDLYREMALIRAFEEACQRGFRQGKIGGYLHVYIGQEAVATGFLQAFKEGDRVITAYRDHAHALLLGSDPKEVMAELYGKGGQCPCLFIIENNKYGMGTSVERTTAMTDLAAKFDAYGIEHEKVDGMDVEAVVEVAERVAEQVRETGQPYAVEAITYRTAPHGAADFFEKYRTKEEIAEWRERDPLAMVEHKLIQNDALDEDELEEIRDGAKERIQEAVTFADESDEPPEEELYTDVYAGEDEYMGEE